VTWFEKKVYQTAEDQVLRCDLDVEIAASFAGFMIHMIWPMPCSDASIESSAMRVSPREMSTAGRPLVSIGVKVTPIQKCEANEEMNFATRARPKTGMRAAVTTPPPSE
jgi:hypothetical protein